MRILLLIIVTAVILPLSADCQNKICVERHILEKVANQLDSFNLLKKIEVQYLNFKDSCLSLTSIQKELLINQGSVISNQKLQILKLQNIEVEHTEMLKVNDEYLKHLQKEKKKLKTKYTISLVGGGILTIGLTTALLASLF